MTEVSLFRLYLLRAAYLLIVVGLGIEIWPGIIHHDQPWELMQGVVNCVLAAVSLLALLGLRYPLQMLPLLFFELIWKSMWLLLVALPLYQADQIDETIATNIAACLMGGIFLIVIPWRYVLATFAMQPAERWR